MDNPFACIEIGSNQVKVIVGNVLNGEAICLYRKTTRCPGLLVNGKVVDEEKLVAALTPLNKIIDETVYFTATISQASFVLPSVGLSVYQNDKTTNVISSQNEIAPIDIQNVVALVNKETVPGDNQIVDIIPDEFILENGERYTQPPLGKKSTSLMIKAKIHALPKQTVNAVTTCANRANIRVRKACVAPYCLAELFKTYQDLPTSYILIDMGAKTTSVHLIGNTSPIGTVPFFVGGDDLTQLLSDGFGIDFNQAETVKIRFGYDIRTSSYNPALVSGIDVSGARSNFRQKDINGVIESYFANYASQMNAAFATLQGKYRADLSSLPILITGGASQLHGLDLFLTRMFPGRDVRIVAPRSIGARDASYSSLLGLLIATSKNIGSLEDNFHGISALTRQAPSKNEGKAKKEKKQKPSHNDDQL